MALPIPSLPSIRFLGRRLVPVRRRTQPGAPPGTITPSPDAPEPEVRVMAYNESDLSEGKVDDPTKLRDYLADWPVTWVDVDGLGDVKQVQAVADVLELHPLALEDVFNNYQRSKVEQYEHYKFIVVRMADVDQGQLVTEQLSLFLSPKFVATFQERPGGDCLDPIRERLRKGHGRIRSAGPDYLAYALVDAVIDHYFPLVESYGDELEKLEVEVLASPNKTTPRRILGARHDLMQFRRAVWPLREALNALLHDETELISKETRVYLRDCYDHTIQLIDMIETYREIGNGLMDVYLSSVSNRMNEIMKVLTVIATIFIPLTFVTSLYGMNFDRTTSPYNMPELGWRYGYPAAWGVMLLMAIGLLLYFRHKGWMSGDDSAQIDEPDQRDS